MDRVLLYTLGLVALILLATISYNNMMARQERHRREGDEEAPDILCKFAVHDGSVVGETVAIDGDRLILKQAGTFKSVAAKLAHIEGDEVHLRGDIDWDASITAGAAWHTANTKGQDDAVTAQLTRSEDVRAPALSVLSDDSEE